MLGKDKSGRRKGAAGPDGRGGPDLDPALGVLADAVAEAVLLLDAGGAPLLANGAFRRMAEDAGTDLGDGGWLGVLAPQDRGRAQALWLEAAEALSPRATGLGLCHGGTALCRIAPVLAGGRAQGWLLTFTDTAPEEELARLRLALLEAEERQRGEAALRSAAEERLSQVEARLHLAEERCRTGEQQAEASRRITDAHAARLETGLARVTAQLAAAEERNRETTARLALAEARFAEVESGGDESPPEEPPPDAGTPAAALADRPEEAASAGADEPPAGTPDEGAAGTLPSPPSASHESDIDRVQQRLRSETLRAFLAGWRELRHGGIAPPPQAWEPDLPDGTLDVKAAKIGPGGQPVRIASIGEQPTGPLVRMLNESGPSDASWRRCAGTARPVHEYARVTLGQGGPLTHERLLLPFSSDGRQVDHVLSLAVATEGPFLPDAEIEVA